MKKKRIALLLCQAKGATVVMPSKLCPHLEGVVRSFTGMVQRGGRDQLVDILLIGWW